MTRSLRAHASNYAWAEIATTVAGIVSFPILTRLLSVADYGTMNLVGSVLGLAVALGKLGVQHAALRSWAEVASGRAGCSMVTLEATVLWGMFATGALVTLAWLALASVIPAGWWGEPGAAAVALLAAPLILVRVVDSAATNDLRAREASGTLATYTVLRRYVALLAVVAALWWWRRDLVALYVITLVVEAAALVGLLAWMFRGRAWPSPKAASWPLYASLAAFGMPMLGSELATVVLAMGDRLVIQTALGPEQLGIYAASFNMCEYVRNALLGAAVAAAYPRCLRIWETEGRAALERFVASFLYPYAVAASFCVALMAIAGRELMTVLASAKYADGGAVTGWIMAALAIQSVLGIAAVGLMVARRSLLVMSLLVAAGALGIAMNTLLVPWLGLRGAGVVVLGVFVLLVVVQMRLARGTVSVVLPWRALGIYGSAAVLAASAAAQIHTGTPWLDLAGRSALLAAAYALALVVWDRPLLERWLPLRRDTTRR